jgi:hypothetical protein
VTTPTSKVLGESRLEHIAEGHKDGWDKWQAWGAVTGWNPCRRRANEVWLKTVLFEFKLDSSAVSYSEYPYGRGHPIGPEVDNLFDSVDD